MPPVQESSRQRRLRRAALAALLANVGIVISGGVVRITGSGLGCPTWPTCDGERLIPRPGSHATWQTAVEFGNRLLTFVVLAAVVAALVQVRRSRPHPGAVTGLSWFLVLGVLGQAALGGVTVLTGLSPVTVAAHFLLSMALIWAAVLLHDRVRGVTAQPVVGTALQWATTALALAAGAVLVLGTVTTGAGPHGGDVQAPRLPIDIRLAAIAHADAVWLLVGLTVALVLLTWWIGPRRLHTALRVLLVVELLQGAVGYTQYALGVPDVLVVLHVVGATLLWTTVATVWARARPLTTPDPVTEPPRDPAAATAGSA